MRVRDVLRSKPSQEVVTISPDATVRELVGLLIEHNVGALIVSTDGATVDGIVSERDIVRRMTEDDLLNAAVSAIMTADVKTCEPTSSLDDLMLVMTDHRVRHVPVLLEGRLEGIVSIGDVVKNRMAELEFERDQLDSYVHQT